MSICGYGKSSSLWDWNNWLAVWIWRILIAHCRIVMWNWRMGTDGLGVGYCWIGGWVLWNLRLGTTVGASLVVQRGAGNGAPCPAPVPNPPPLLCSCSAPSPALQVLNTTASFCTELICYAHELLIIWLQCMSHCCVVLLRQTTCIVRQLTGMALH